MPVCRRVSGAPPRIISRTYRAQSDHLLPFRGRMFPLSPITLSSYLDPARSPFVALVPEGGYYFLTCFTDLGAGEPARPSRRLTSDENERAGPVGHRWWIAFHAEGKINEFRASASLFEAGNSRNQADIDLLKRFVNYRGYNVVPRTNAWVCCTDRWHLIWLVREGGLEGCCCAKALSP